MQRPKTIGKGISRPRIRRVVEGISLWLAVLLMLFVHPLYAEARPMDMAQPGQLYLMDGQNARQQPALILDSDVIVRWRPLGPWGFHRDSHQCRDRPGLEPTVCSDMFALAIVMLNRRQTL